MYRPSPYTPIHRYINKIQSFVFISGLTNAIIFFSAINCSASDSYFDHLFQRSVYIENLNIPGGWWANPALLSQVDEGMLFSSNVLPLGNRYLISSIRILFPVKSILSIGAGILGAGNYKTGTSHSAITEDGFLYRSDFAFKRPRFQFGAGANVPVIGALGILTSFGTDIKDRGGEYQEDKVLSPGFSFGWLSPEIFIPVQISTNFMFLFHNIEYKGKNTFWELGSKLGVSFHALDSLLSGFCEYTFSFGQNSFGIFTPDSSEYETAKAMLSIRIFNNVAAIIGASRDVGYYSPVNGTCIHFGAELRKSSILPFWAGYDIGARVGKDWIILHRIWMCLDLKIFNRENDSETYE